MARSLLGGRSCLVLGAVGAGKTHELLSVAGQLGGAGRLAFLSGGEWGVGSFVELLLRVLGALAQRYPGEHLAQRLDSLYASHSEDPARALSEAKEALRAFVGGGALFLLCDDLDQLLAGLEAGAQRQWISLLKERPGWVLLGAASSSPKGAFSGFFEVFSLAPLTIDGALAVLRERAAREDPRPLLAALETPAGRARIAALHHLFGGAPRTYLSLYEGLRRGSLFGPLLRALALEHQASLWRLAPLQRKIVALLCEEARPVTVGRVAERCLCSPQSAAKQLGELSLMGVVQKSPLGREVYCELSSVSLRLYLELKHHRGEALRGCLQFLQHWFYEEAAAPEAPPAWPLELVDPAALPEALQRAARQVDERGAEGDFLALASAQWSAEERRASLRTLIRGLIFHNSEALLGLLESSLFGPEAVLLELDSMREFAKRSSRLWALRGALLLRLGRFEEAIQNSEQILATNPEYRALSWLQARALLGLGEQGGALRILSEVLAASPAPEVLGGLRDLLFAEVSRGGADAAARFGEALGAVLLPREHLPGGLLALVLKGLLQRGLLGDPAWEAVVERWTGCYGALPDCFISLQMMRAASRWLARHDRAALLALPLEQRALVVAAIEERGRLAGNKAGGAERGAGDI